MGIDIEKMRRKLEAMQNGTTDRKDNPDKFTMKKDGTASKLRMIEYPYGEDPFVELWLHYGVGKGEGFLCPRKNHGEKCPICDFAFEEVKDATAAVKEALKD